MMEFYHGKFLIPAAGRRQSRMKLERTPHPPSYVGHPFPWERASSQDHSPLRWGED
jgi:hypothetical protein